MIIFNKKKMMCNGHAQALSFFPFSFSKPCPSHHFSFTLEHATLCRATQPLFPLREPLTPTLTSLRRQPHPLSCDKPLQPPSSFSSTTCKRYICCSSTHIYVFLIFYFIFTRLCCSSPLLPFLWNFPLCGSFFLRVSAREREKKITFLGNSANLGDS